ncbi:MAG: MBL fold metallo-hydrolase [Ignavibacteriae bacterium]|nr:MBL fold metallo-hydrolase [Ignavibacteriota bacterium]
MLSRRTFLSALGLSLLRSSKLFSDQEQRKRSWKDIIFSDHEIAPAPERPHPASWDNSGLTVSWIGHATVLINFFGTTIITDPVFSDRIGINILNLFIIGQKRLVSPALAFEGLPPIDVILLSHPHMDHLDLPTLRRFKRTIPIVMAKNTSDILWRRGWKHIHEVDWGETMIMAGVSIEALKVKHFGWRYPWEQDRSRGNWKGRSFNAYLLSKNGRNIVFGGDTAYHEYFKQLAERNISIDLAMMPIGAYDPWVFAHANPEQAVAMATHMNAAHILPIHWGTFTLSYEPTNEPIERLQNALTKHSPKLALERIGQTWKID